MTINDDNLNGKMILSILLLFLLIAFPPASLAVCPVCVVAVGAGVGVSRWLGIDDTVSGLWFGGLLAAFSLWMVNWTAKKGWKIPYRNVLIIGATYLLTGLPLVLSDIVGHPENRLWGIDKLLLGIVIGTGLFFLNLKVDRWLRSKNGGKVYVAYQKVIIPVVTLLLGSLVFYLITK